MCRYLHNGEDRVLEPDGVNTVLPLRHRGVDVDGAGLGAQPHGGQQARHLGHLAVRQLIFLDVNR